MMCFGQNRGRGSWIRYAFLIPIAIAAGVFLFGWVVMLLWNAILPAVLGVKIISFWQALGIIVLSKILFGVFRGGHRHHDCRHYPREEHLKRWMHMSREEREKMRAEWKERYSPHTEQE